MVKNLYKDTIHLLHLYLNKSASCGYADLVTLTLASLLLFLLRQRGGQVSLFFPPSDRPTDRPHAWIRSRNFGHFCPRARRPCRPRSLVRAPKWLSHSRPAGRNTKPSCRRSARYPMDDVNVLPKYVYSAAFDFLFLSRHFYLWPTGPHSFCFREPLSIDHVLGRTAPAAANVLLALALP